MRIVIGKKKALNLLEEGRKENAAAMIVKKINDPLLRDILQTEVLASIIEADPTPNKKYIEWAARRIAEVVRKEEDDEYLEVLKTFQDDPEGFAIFDRLPDERKELVKGYTDLQRQQGGYLKNDERIKNRREAVRGIVFAKLQSLQRRLPIYHRAAERGLVDKNIDKYKNLYDWEHDVYTAERELAERDHMKRIEQQAKESTDYIHDDDSFMIVRPRSADASCYYGKGTKWCISATQSRNYFDQYTGEGTGFYFVMFKHLSPDDPYKKMALVYTAGDYDEPAEVYDAEDDEVSTDGLRDAVEANIFSAALKNILKAEIRQMKKDGLDAQKYLRGRIEDVSTAYGELDDILGDGDFGMAKRRAEGVLVAGPEGERMYTELGYDVEELKASGPKLEILEKVLEELGLDEESLGVAEAVDIQEHVGDLLTDQYHEVVGYSGGHFGDNPAGPTDADFDALREQHKYDYIYVSYEEYDENRMYWDGGYSLDVTDIHEDLDGAGPDEVADVLRKVLDDYNVFPDEIQGWQNDISITFNPDYDENTGLNGFENFLNRMDDVDLALHKMLEEDIDQTHAAFIDAGLIAGQSMKTLKERFDNLELENFDIDIEERDLSIYTRLDITVPIPAHMYKGLTAGAAEWQTGFRGDIARSDSLLAFDKMLQDKSTNYSDQLIDHISNTFDKVFEMYANKLKNTLPGFEREAPDRETLGLLVPDYNVGIYRTAQKTNVGPSGLLTPYFFDVRIETDEEESLEEPNLKLIELFLKTIDRGDMVEKIRNRLEVIIQNDAVKNIIPLFKPGEDSPELDTVTGKIVAPGEEGYKSKKFADELGTFFESKKRLKIIINEQAPYGGYSPGALAGTMGSNLGASPGPIHTPDEESGVAEDGDIRVKVVLHRNGQVLLLHNDQGWDLPGGHLKKDEGILDGLIREVREETGISISTDQIESLHMSDGNTKFFKAEFGSDDVVLSDEHDDYIFMSLQDIGDEENLSPKFKKAVVKALKGLNEQKSHKKLTLRIG